MAASRVHFVATAAEAPEARPDTLVIVLDPAWTPGTADRDDLLCARRLLGGVVERIDLFDTALDHVDAWADATGIADRLDVEGVTYWFRMRETMWRWLHERLLWRHALAELGTDDNVTDIDIPPDHPALADVARRLWPNAAPSSEPDDATVAASTTIGAHSGRTATIGAGGARASTLRRVARAMLGRSTPPAPTPEAMERARREKILADRVARLVGDSGPRVLVLTNPSTHQRVGGPDGDRQDPLFGVVIPRLGSAGMQPVLLGTGLDQRQDHDWALIEHDDRLLPQFLLRSRWSAPEDEDRVQLALSTMVATIDSVRATTLDVDGIDVGSDFVGGLHAAATHVIRSDIHTLARVERLIAELTPRAIVLAQEGIRTPWLMAGRRAGIPVFAVQHGVLYAGHAGYPNRRHPALALPTKTFVCGEFERRVLLARGAYLPDEVETAGSPRLDMDAAAVDADGLATERMAVRRELGVADGDRLLVVSSVNLRFLQQSHFAHMIEVVLGGPLPGVHVVFKQHPGEHDEGPYRDLLTGLAEAGGYDAPAITVVKDIDLYRLLRAADAHLGLLSTVLTEAVVVGTLNLIAQTDRHADLLGYVDAGVAWPVRTPTDVVVAVTDPHPSDPSARAAFLADHFRAGDASGRIVAAVGAAVALAEA